MAGTTKSILVMLVALLLAAVPAAAVECVKPGGPGACFPTIQEAVDAATAGEFIAIYPGVYRGPVVIPPEKPALKLVGKGLKPTAVRIDLSREPFPRIGIDIQGASDVTIQNLTVQGTSATAISSGGGANRVTVSKVRVFASRGPCITLNGNDNRVLSTGVRGCSGNGILVAGNRGLVSGSSAAMVGYGIEVQSHDGRVVTCRVSQVRESGITARGDSVEVRSSRVERAGGPGIIIYGRDAAGASSPVKIIGNTVIDTGMEGISVDDVASVGAAVGEVSGNIVSGGTNNGILVKCPPTASCGGSSVANNHVSRTVGQGGGAGINVLGGAPGLVVRNNVAASNARFGFELQGTGLVIRDNTAMDNGDGTLNVSGFAVSGTAHEVRRNTAVGNVSDGIRLYGAGFAAVADNVARGNYNVGIVVTEGSTGLTLTRCTASENFLFGFFVDADAVNTTLTGCTGKFNKGYDLCNQNGSASIDGGTFGTTGCP